MLAEDAWDAESLQMLKDSYRELIGTTIPSYPSPAQAWAELQRFNPYPAEAAAEEEAVASPADPPAAAGAPGADKAVTFRAGDVTPRSGAALDEQKQAKLDELNRHNLSKKELVAREEELRARDEARRQEQVREGEASRPGDAVVDGLLLFACALSVPYELAAVSHLPALPAR